MKIVELAKHVRLYVQENKNKNIKISTASVTSLCIEVCKKKPCKLKCDKETVSLIVCPRP